MLPMPNSAIINAIACGVPSESAASSSDETMPLPYCSEPSRAEAEPAICGTPLSAAAVVQAAMMPLVAKNTNTGRIMP